MESSECVSRREHPLDAVVHFMFLDKLTTVRLLQTTTNRRAEVFVVLQQFQGGVLDQLLRVHTLLSGDLVELGNLVGTEPYFHAVSVWGTSHSVNCFPEG